ncbi:predicted protein [Naegleria gruberi]|uniref:Predicted protein n=1 Tax=Naegleria gruberi TaxID=5762 RepID=D2VYI0_NAEGR|nr:uncharacterized protein NAEGRDRAFT_53266 [Naegleria gruberi]EFC38065.1 predicted protein [Naegleria gruberi]|eukprot:XP_002670809.1 predicted protein [Naegleria gruberi strain NEG-M]
MDDQGRLIRINDENGKPLGLFADEGSVNETHQVVISEWNDREMIFSQSMDLKERKFLKFKLNQKKVEESFVERVHVEVSHQLSHSLYRADHPLNVPVIGKAQNVLLTHLAFDRFSQKSNLAIFNIEKNENHSLKISQKFSTEEDTHAFYIALMESNLGQKYILKYAFQKPSYSSIGYVSLNNTKKFSYTPIRVDGFEGIFQKNTCKMSQILCHTQLSEGKYLFMTYSKSSKRISSDFQHYFTNEIVWILVDVNEKRTKRVYPRVYNIAANTTTGHERTFLNQSNQDETSFQTVQKKKRGGKIQKKFHTDEEHLYLDGDLNGGYSDSSLLKKINGITNSSIDQTSTSVMIPILKEDITNNDVTMRAFRPFFSNPDIFQVLVFFSKVVEDGVDFNPHFGKMFSYFFQFKNETKVKVRKVGRRFSDVNIITCSTSKVGTAGGSNRQFSKVLAFQ